jgi:hypothetical protein
LGMADGMSWGCGMKEAIPCPYCGKIGRHEWAGEGGCPGAEIDRMTSEEKLIIKRLKATFADVDEMRAVFDIVTKTLALREAELSVAKALLARAADALDNPRGGSEALDDDFDLIIELRKAANGSELGMNRREFSISLTEGKDGLFLARGLGFEGGGKTVKEALDAWVQAIVDDAILKCAELRKAAE